MQFRDWKEALRFKILENQLVKNTKNSYLLAVNQEGWGSNEDGIEAFDMSVAAGTSTNDVFGFDLGFGSGPCFPI